MEYSDKPLAEDVQYVQSVLNTIQRELKAPKGQVNKFGNYKYRSCEDILEAVKPYLGRCILRITDEVVQIGDRYYIKAAARIAYLTAQLECQAFAREPEIKKGMDESQITGAASSYARKYALNGLFAIDDTKDADFTNTHDDKVVINKEDADLVKQAIGINDNSFVQSIAKQLKEKGSLSEKQRESLASMVMDKSLYTNGATFTDHLQEVKDSK